MTSEVTGFVSTKETEINLNEYEVYYLTSLTFSTVDPPMSFEGHRAGIQVGTHIKF
jgi:hypothetical protein